MNKITIQKITKLNPESALIKELYQRSTDCAKEREYPPATFDKWWAGVIKQHEQSDFCDWFCFADELKALGYCFFTQWPGEKACYIHFQIPSKSDSAELLKAIIGFVNQQEKRGKVIIRTSFKLIQNACKQTHLKQGNEIQHFKKEVNQLSKDQLKKWASLIPSDLKIEYQNYVSDDSLEDVAYMMTTYLNQMIRPDKHETFSEKPHQIKRFMEFSKKNGTSFIHVILRDKNDKPMGLCVGRYDEEKPIVYAQRMTGVDESLRGKRLGIALKSLCYLRILEELPFMEKIITDCYVANTPIIKTNLKMGFERTHQVKEYYN